MTQMISCDSTNTLVSIKTKILIIKLADDKSSYEFLWSIPDWRSVRKYSSSINYQKAIFETGASSWFQTKWLAGLKSKESSYCWVNENVHLYWQLLDIRGTHLVKLEADVQSQLLAVDGTYKQINEKPQEVGFGDIIEAKQELIERLHNNHVSKDLEYVHSDGSIKIKLIVTLKIPKMSPAEYHKYKLEKFVEKSHNNFYSNFASILNDDSAADFKIVTSDGIELLAHKIILKAQCPVFAGMLNSDLTEISSGVVKVDDVSADTMKVILHYFYTGELFISMDACNIVEFTYAAGKYQMTTVLGLLDDLLGRNEQEEASFTDVQLLGLADKLSLKNAETKLLENIVAKIQKITTSDELYELFGFDREKMFQIAEKMANEKIGEIGVLETMDYLLGSSDHENICEIGLPLLGLLQKRSLKMFEKTLLKLFASKAKKFNSAEELFAVFGHGKEI